MRGIFSGIPLGMILGIALYRRDFELLAYAALGLMVGALAIELWRYWRA